MKIKVDTDVVAGTNRGGEDLFLIIKAESEATDDKALLRELTDNVDAAVNEVLDELGQRDPDDSEIWSEQGQVKSTPTEYEFSIDISEPDFAKLLRDKVKSVNLWKQERSVGGKLKWVFHHEHYVAGNAD